MYTEERRALILKEVLEEKKASITELALKFNVSDETIRRDLRQLSLEKKIVKVHGGALAPSHPAREETYDIRSKTHKKAKQAMGRYAASLIRDGDIIALDYGSSAEELARSIFGVRDITIITNSFLTAEILLEKRSREEFTGKILFLGGLVDLHTAKTIGEFTIAQMERFSLDKAFLCTTSVSRSGLMMWDEREGEYSASLAHQASEVYVMADSSKFGKESFYRFLDFGQVDAIITDNENKISSSLKHLLNEKDVELHIVESAQEEEK